MRGIKIGMTIAEVEKQYEIVNKKDSEDGFKVGVIRFKEAYYTLYFMNGSLHSLKAVYQKSFGSDEEFTEQLSKSLNLPNSWRKIDSISVGMDCQDFFVRVSTVILLPTSEFSITKIIPAEPFKP